MSDEELKNLVASLAIAQAKTDEQLKETERYIKLLFQESDERFKKTDEQMKKTFFELAQSDKKTDEKLDKVAKLVGNISNNQGDVAEEFFYNSLTANPTLDGVTYDLTYKNVTARQGNTEDEYDILMVNGKDVAIVEIKYKAHKNEVISLIDKKYPNFKKLYPEYSHYNHHLALASFYINDDVKNEALQNNIMILQRKGDIIETIMPSSFPT